MKILWFTWKDKTHPQAGGAELMNEELAKRLIKDGHEVILLVGGYKNSKTEEMIDGYKVIRVGNRYTIYLQAAIYYLRNFKNWPDLIIEEINTIPFMTQWYAKQKRALLIYQLCREIWFYQMAFPFNIIGFIFEPIYLWLLRKNKVVTESDSTKNDLASYGFSKENINMVPIGLDITPVKNLDTIKKYAQFTVLSLGAIRSMKRTVDQIKAFELAKKKMPNLQMKIAGDSNGSYSAKVLDIIANSKYKNDIDYLGRVSKEEKIELMQKSHVILVTSTKEGWGLIVTEANSQGTPAIVYDVDGLRDSVANNKTGIITKENDPQAMAIEIKKLYTNPKLYRSLQENALNLSKELTFAKSYQEFKKLINLSS